MNIQCVVGLDIGGTNCRIGMVDYANNLYHAQIINTVDLQFNGKFLDGLLDFTQQYIDQYQSKFDIIAISMGFPSTINRDRSVLLSTPNIEGLNNIPIVSLCEKVFKIPVFINRDVNMLLYHDIYYFHIPKDEIILGFYIGTGLGNAIYINNKVLLGKHGVAGELGHIPIIGSEKRCSCGNEGCIEAIAAGRYLEELCQTRFVGTPIKDIYIKHLNTPEIREQVEYLSIPIATEINIFDPHYIILGGGILQMEGFPKDLLEEFIIKHSRKPYPAEGLSILYALTEQENGIIGAGIYGFHMLGEMPD
jgi:allose kinase